jgi:DNA anti-recombination protein RmuC
MSDIKSKSTAAMKASTGEKKTPVTPEQRYRMIAEAAYFRTEKRGFVGGDAAQDWLEAEVEIDRILQQSSEPGKEGMTIKQAFQQKLEAQLKEWDDKFDELKAKGQEAKAEIRADIEKQIESLSDKREAAQAKILELRRHTEDAWEDLKTDAEKTWEEMREALDRFVSHFK